MRRASRGRLDSPLSWREVSGTGGFEMVTGAGWGAAAGWEGGEVCPLVWGTSPLTSAMMVVWGSYFGGIEGEARLPSGVDGLEESRGS